MTVGTLVRLATSMKRAAKAGVRLKCVRWSNWYAICINFSSDHGLPRISIPTGIPIGASAVAGENPMGTVTTGEPVRAARMPFRWL